MRRNLLIDALLVMLLAASAGGCNTPAGRIAPAPAPPPPPVKVNLRIELTDMDGPPLVLADWPTVQS